MKIICWLEHYGQWLELGLLLPVTALLQRYMLYQLSSLQSTVCSEHLSYLRLVQWEMNRKVES